MDLDSQLCFYEPPSNADFPQIGNPTYRDVHFNIISAYRFDRKIISKKACITTLEKFQRDNMYLTNDASCAIILGKGDVFMRKSGIPYRVYKKSRVATFFSAISSVASRVLFSFSLFLIFVEFRLFLLMSIVQFVFWHYQEEIEKYLADSIPDVQGYDYPSFQVGEEEYQLAKKVLEFGRFHPAIKEIAQLQSRSPKEVIQYYESVIRNYNLEQRKDNHAGDIYIEYIKFTH